MVRFTAKIHTLIINQLRHNKSNIKFMSCIFPETGSGLPLLTTTEKKFCLPVLTNVVLGSPNRKCQGAGICIVVPYQMHKKMCWTCPSVRAWVQSLSRGKLRMCFWRSDCSSGMIEQFFSSAIFVVESDYALSSSVSGLLGVEGFVIKGGQYNLKVSAKYYIVEFLQY